MTIHSGPGPSWCLSSLCQHLVSICLGTPKSLPHPVFPPGNTTPAKINSSVSIPVLGFGFGFDFSSFAVADVENLSSSSVAVAQHLAVCVVV